MVGVKESGRGAPARTRSTRGLGAELRPLRTELPRGGARSSAGGAELPRGSTCSPCGAELPVRSTSVGWVRRTMHAHSVRGTLVFGGCFGAPQQLLRGTCKLILSIRGEGMNQLKPHEQHDVPRDRHKSVRSPRDCRFVGGNLNAKGFPAQAEKSARTSL